jgi:hypothetical protein
MFADSDDALWGTTALETHVAMQHETHADIVHFRSAIVDGEGNFVRYCWAEPFAPSLQGENIFAAYVNGGKQRSGVVWDKIFSRRLWLPLLPDLSELPALRHMEDVCLSSYTYCHARSYVGSDELGYAYYYINNESAKGMIRSLETYALLQNLLPLLYNCAPDKELVGLFNRSLLSLLPQFAMQAGVYAAEFGNGAVSDTYIKEALELSDSGTIIKTLLAAAMLSKGVPERTSYLKDAIERLKGCDVYFWGCGYLYDVKKYLFCETKPRCIIVDSDMLPDSDVIDGLSVKTPADVLNGTEIIPIIVFARDTNKIYQTIKNHYPEYTDIIFCNML